MVIHKTLLFWLLYLIIVVFLGGVSYLLGLPQLVLIHDHVHMSALLIGFYVMAELLAARQVVAVSKMHRSVSNLRHWLSRAQLADIAVDPKGVILFGSDGSSHDVRGHMAQHILDLKAKVSAAERGKRIDQGLLLDTLAERLHHKALIGDFVAARIVWIGILATVVGVVLAFWPFIGSSFDIETLRANLGSFFDGIAVAFLPTALSFVFKIAMDFNTRILVSGLNDLMEEITTVSDVHILPFLDRSKGA